MRIVYDIGDDVGYPHFGDVGGRRMTVLDRNVIIYRSGKSYVEYLLDGLLEHLAEDMHTNVEKDFDNLIVVAGKEGSGKSNLAYHLCKLYDPDFNVEDGYIYEFHAFIEKLTENQGGDRGKIFWMDEATNIASNRDWMKNDNKTFIQMLEMMRSRGWSLVMCIPSVERLDVYIREFRLRYLLVTKEMKWENNQTFGRGYVEIKLPLKNDRWRTIGYARFPQMSKDEKEKYEQIKMSHQDEKIQEIQRKVEKEKRTKSRFEQDRKNIRTLVLYAYESGRTYNEIAQMLGCSRENVKLLLRQARDERDGQTDEGGDGT